MAFQWAQDDPKFQRQLQKMAAMGPESKAIFNAGAAEEAWASTNAAKNLRLMQIGNDLKNRKKSFQINMNYKRRNQQLREKAFGHQKRQDRYGTILGALNLGVTGATSYMKNKSSLRQAKRTNDLYERLLSRR